MTQTQSHGETRMRFLAMNNSGCWRLKREGFNVGWMMSPNGQRRPERKGVLMDWAQDNGMYHPEGGIPKPESACGAVLGALSRVYREEWPQPMFAVVPDVPYDGPASRERMRRYLPLMREMFPLTPLAVAVQNGMGEDDLDGFDWVFIAGSTDWKEATSAYWVDRGHERGMKVHAARVTTARRLSMMQDAGCDTADGNIWFGDKSQKQGLLMALNQLRLYAEVA